MPLMLLLAFYFALFTNVSQVDVCERIVFGSQGHFGLFLPKCNTGNGIREIIQRSDSFQLRSRTRVNSRRWMERICTGI